MEVHYNLVAALISNLCGGLILFSIFLSSHLVRERKVNTHNRWMFAMIVVCFIGCITEIIFELINGQIFPFSRELNLIVKSYNHLESDVAGFLFIGYLYEVVHKGEKWPKTLKMTAIIISTVSVGLLIANVFTGIIFTFSDENVYSRGPLGQLGLALSILTMIYTVILMSTDNRRTKAYLRFPVLLYTIPFILGGGLQMVNPSLRLSCVAFALGITTTHLNVQKRLLYTDPMSGVYNRSFMDYYFSTAEKKRQGIPFGGLLVDINAFKEINDTLGHLMGDEAIKNAADVLRKSAGTDYLVMRYGGDEFILIKENDTLEGASAQRIQIQNALEEFNRENNLPYELSFSVGVASLEMSAGGFDKFLEKMDRSLEEDKRAYYERTGKDRRK